MNFSFSAQKRGDEKVEVLRQNNLIPGIVYGAGMEPVSVAVAYNPFAKLYDEAGESSLIDLAIEGGKSIKVLVQSLQYDPVKGKIVHVDFRQINMNKEMTATVELNFVGESLAVKELGGTLMKAHDSLEVTCLPQDLVSEITVDLSLLKTFSDIIHVKDLQLPKGIKVEEDPDQVIVKVSAPLTEEQLKAMEETTAPSLEQIEVEKKGKEEVEGEEKPSADAQGKKDEGKSASGGKEEKK